MPSLSSLPPTRAQRSLAGLSLAAASGRSLAGLRGKPDTSFRPASERFQLRPAHKPLAGLAAAGAPAARPPWLPSQGRDESPAQPPPSPLSPSFNRRRRLHPRRAKEGGLGARSSASFRLIGKGFGPGTVRESRPRRSWAKRGRSVTSIPRKVKAPTGNPPLFADRELFGGLGAPERSPADTPRPVPPLQTHLSASALPLLTSAAAAALVSHAGWAAQAGNWLRRVLVFSGTAVATHLRSP
ncbi:uncharacterized protein LOC120307053 [Crotalus tigris]|uniref:uncharacterized protein LOC120307053 n=1 Tax=Crotalus tigris TaxID=88082 RepID=UPI00192F6D0B|nr:uncharacterized protein LOC120307053 [Crotalus tigris]